MSKNIFDELREHFGSGNWFVNAEAREKTKTNEQKILDKEFHSSVKDGNRERSVELFDKGATNDYHGYDGRTALHWACEKGDLNIAKKIIQKFQAELERKTTFGDGFLTPIGFAFQGRQTEVAKWLLQMGAKNLIFQAVQSAGNNGDVFGFDIIHQTGRATEYISEDLPKMKELKVLTTNRTLYGLQKLMKYYEMDEKTFATIVNILLNFKFENDPNGEKLWNEEIAEFEIINQWAIRNEKWDYFIDNCTKTGGIGILEFVPRDLVPEILTKVLNNWIKSNKEIVDKTFDDLKKFLKLHEKDEEMFNPLITVYEQFDVDQNGHLVKHLESTNQTLFKHILDFGHGQLKEDISQTSNHTTIQNLCEACTEGNERKVNVIISEFQDILDEPIPSGSPTPLSNAIQYGQLEIMEILIKKGAKNIIQNLI